MNKCDLCTELPEVIRNSSLHGVTVPISALDGRGVDTLVEELEKLALRGKELRIFMIPTSEQWAVSYLYENATVENVEYTPTHALITAVVDEKTKGRLLKYLSEK